MREREREKEEELLVFVRRPRPQVSVPSLLPGTAAVGGDGVQLPSPWRGITEGPLRGRGPVSWWPAAWEARDGVCGPGASSFGVTHQSVSCAIFSCMISLV